MNTVFYKGMDISFLPQCLDNGMVVKDFDGTIMEPFELLKKYGVNSIRLRIWHTPSNVPASGGYCDLPHTIDMAKKICENGMTFMLDFHYSDFWADPGQQNKPKAWKDLSFEELKDAVYDYTRDTLLALQDEGVLPEVVQIGNEIRSGLLFPDGELPDYKQMVQLVNAGIDGARSVAGPEQMKVMIHLDQGGRYFYLKEWFEKSFAEGLKDFDLIGLSYYPFWHGTFADLRATMDRLLEDYHKPIMIMETAHAWRKSKNGFIDEAQERIAGFQATPEGQRKVLDLVASINASLPDGMGQGFFYWEPICQADKGAGNWGENMGLLADDGTIMEGIHAFEFTREKLRPKDVAKIYEPQTITVHVGEKVILPENISVLLFDGSIEKKHVIWNCSQDTSFGEAGDYRIEGAMEGIAESVAACVRVEEKTAGRNNLLVNTDWENGLDQWEIESSKEQVIYQIYPEFVDPYPAPPVNALRVEGNKNFTFRVSQKVLVSEAGNYMLQVAFQGTDTTGVDVRLFAQQGEYYKELTIHPTEHGFEVYQIPELELQEGAVTVGIKIAAPPMYGMMRGFSLVQK